jgi:hypothetical protein
VTLRRAVLDFNAAFCRFGEAIEGPDWSKVGPDAWVTLVIAMDRLREAAGLDCLVTTTIDKGLKYTWVLRKETT